STLPPSSVPTRVCPGPWPVGRAFGEQPFGADEDVVAVTFGPDGLWSVEEGGELRQWDIATGRQLQWHALDEDATLWAFRPDGRVLAGAGSDMVLWDVANGRRRLVIPQHSWVTALAFARSSELVATGHDDGSVQLWDTADGQLVRRLRGCMRPISALAFSPDGKRLASAGEDKQMLLWNVGAGGVDGLLSGHT